MNSGMKGILYQCEVVVLQLLPLLLVILYYKQVESKQREEQSRTQDGVSHRCQGCQAYLRFNKYIFFVITESREQRIRLIC